MLTKYIRAAMRHAEYEILEDGTFGAGIPGFAGLWANEKTLEECREELQSALEDWIMLGISLHHSMPVVDEIDINPKQEVA